MLSREPYAYGRYSLNRHHVFCVKPFSMLSHNRGPCRVLCNDSRMGPLLHVRMKAWHIANTLPWNFNGRRTRIMSISTAALDSANSLSRHRTVATRSPPLHSPRLHFTPVHSGLPHSTPLRFSASHYTPLFPAEICSLDRFDLTIIRQDPYGKQCVKRHGRVASPVPHFLRTSATGTKTVRAAMVCDERPQGRRSDRKSVV